MLHNQIDYHWWELLLSWAGWAGAALFSSSTLTACMVVYTLLRIFFLLKHWRSKSATKELSDVE